MENDLITIIVPVYNVEKYLERCVFSLINQSYSNIEIILSDDGSTDSSGKLCDHFEEIDKRVTVIHASNGGLSEARNRGIKKSKGKFICFVDSDDWVDHNYILLLYYTLTITKTRIAECGYLQFKNDIINPITDFSISTFDYNEAMSAICSRGYERHIVVWNKLYDKALFDDILFPPSKLHEDEFIMHLLIDKAKAMSHIDCTLYYYRFNSNSIIHKKITVSRLDAIDAINNRLVFFRNNSLNKQINECSMLLYTVFCNFAEVNKNQIDNYNDFFIALNKLFHKYKKNIAIKKFNFIDKFYFIFGYKNVLRLKNRNKLQYYYQRLKDVCHSFCNIFKSLFILLGSIINTFSIIFLFIEKRISSIRYKKPIAILLSCVEYRNYGDLAIGLAQRQYLNTFFVVIEINQKTTKKKIHILKHFIKDNYFLFLPGGGNMGDRWSNDESIRRLIIISFPNNFITCFPQSVDYSRTLNGKNSLEESKIIYNNHSSLLLCARDNVSYGLLKEYYPKVNSILVPDIALSLNLSYVKTIKQNNLVGLCLRNDKEIWFKGISLVLGVIHHLTTHNIGYSFFSTVAKGDTVLAKREIELNSLLSTMSKYKLIVTDRLHCIIFCYLLKIKCLVINNNNDKIINFVNTWFDNVKFIKLIDDIENDISLFMSDSNQDFFENDGGKVDYDNLKKSIADMLLKQ